MRIAVMGGALVNSGDFLIEQRSKELLEAITDAEVDILKRNISYDDKVDVLNGYDMIVFAGGPIFQRNIYPKRIPFVRKLTKINTPIRIFGGGWKGYNISHRVMYKKYKFTKEMMSFIDNISKQYPLGCRDWYTMRTLQKSNVKNLIMTGCPAWYDLSRIDSLKLDKKYNDSTISDSVTIGISDPALPCNKPYFYGLVNFIVRKYHNANIKLFFRRGISKEDLAKVKLLCKEYSKLAYVDLSGSAEGFKQYNQCFLHIGFRVHAHIYNLSQGNVSVLINEDARGIGVNHALGIENIDCLLKNSRFFKPSVSNQILETIVLDYLRYIEKSGYMQYRRAYKQIREYFNVAKSFIAGMI